MYDKTQFNSMCHSKLQYNKLALPVSIMTTVLSIVVPCVVFRYYSVGLLVINTHRLMAT